MHMKTGEKPFKCKICQKTYLEKAYLASHIKDTHAEEKPFKCDFCEKFYSRRSRLNLHMRMHTKEKHYKCDICQKLELKKLWI